MKAEMEGKMDPLFSLLFGVEDEGARPTEAQVTPEVSMEDELREIVMRSIARALAPAVGEVDRPDVFAALEERFAWGPVVGIGTLEYLRDRKP
jgi:hypothetical protein